MYIMNRLEDAQQATTDERVRKVTEATSLQSRVSLSSYAARGCFGKVLGEEEQCLVFVDLPPCKAAGIAETTVTSFFSLIDTLSGGRRRS